MPIFHGIRYDVQHGVLLGVGDDSGSGGVVTNYTRDTSETVTTAEANARVHGTARGTAETVTTAESVAVVARPAADGPGNTIYRPLVASDFTLLGITTPGHSYGCQEASGNLADSIGGMTLTAAGSPGYQQTMPTGWACKGVSFTEVSSQKFGVGSGTGPDPSSTSVMYLIYAVCDNGSPAATRTLMGCGTTLGLEHNATDRLLGDNVTVTATDATTLPGADALVHPMVLVHDRTNSTFTIYTDEAKTTGTYNATALDGNKGIGGAFAAVTTSFHGKICYFLIWSGADAELNSTQVKARLTALGWTIPWS